MGPMAGEAGELDRETSVYCLLHVRANSFTSHTVVDNVNGLLLRKSDIIHHYHARS